jgi:hypothetical protein
MNQKHLVSIAGICLFVFISVIGMKTISTRTLLQAQNTPAQPGDKEDRKAVLHRNCRELLRSRLRDTGLEALGNEPGSPNSIEIRVWYGFTDRKLLGFVLKKTNQVWSAVYVPHYASESEKAPVPLPVPKSGWESFWKTLEGLDIYTLPDAHDIGQINATELEARALFVEIKTPEKYRVYLYGGYYGDYPTQDTPHNETWKAWQILQTLSDEFGKPI